MHQMGGPCGVGILSISSLKRDLASGMVSTSHRTAGMYIAAFRNDDRGFLLDNRELIKNGDKRGVV